MSERLREKPERKEALKRIIRRLHEGESPEDMKEEFKEVIGDVTSVEIAKIEEELIKEGMPRDEVHRLCDVHIAVFKESLESEKVLAPPGHPVNILMEEHEILLGYARELGIIAEDLGEKGDFDSIADEVKHLDHIADHLKDSESHYVREENVLFPYLEKHGVTEPPAMMWAEHDKIRDIKKGLYTILDTKEGMVFGEFVKALQEVGASLADMLSSHFYKENNILFPTALKVMEETEWKDARQQFDELGYCCFTPELGKMAVEVEAEAPSAEVGDVIAFETGTLSKEVIEAVLNTLPVDITFVDSDDIVRYFSQSKERIFPRTKAVIGRSVQQCHPQKSVHVVNQILEDFRSGSRDSAGFWIDLKGRKIYIRYFPVHGENGDYLGCLEVTQDITDIGQIEGEKRLL
jgi:PAS domain S-box-containing protein